MSLSQRAVLQSTNPCQTRACDPCSKYRQKHFDTQLRCIERSTSLNQQRACLRLKGLCALAPCWQELMATIISYQFTTDTRKNHLLLGTHNIYIYICAMTRCWVIEAPWSVHWHHPRFTFAASTRKTFHMHWWWHCSWSRWVAHCDCASTCIMGELVYITCGSMFVERRDRMNIIVSIPPLLAIVPCCDWPELIRNNDYHCSLGLQTDVSSSESPSASGNDRRWCWRCRKWYPERIPGIPTKEW